MADDRVLVQIPLEWTDETLKIFLNEVRTAWPDDASKQNEMLGWAMRSWRLVIDIHLGKTS